MQGFFFSLLKTYIVRAVNRSSPWRVGNTIPLTMPRKKSVACLHGLCQLVCSHSAEDIESRLAWSILPDCKVSPPLRTVISVPSGFVISVHTRSFQTSPSYFHRHDIATRDGVSLGKPSTTTLWRLLLHLCAGCNSSRPSTFRAKIFFEGRDMA